MAIDRIEIDELVSLRVQARGIDLSSRRRVMTELAGSRVSGFRGRGMEFEEHRLYQAGDEARSIDWRVTARTGRPHVRVYREERERPLLLVIDLRHAMWFGTRGCFKAVLAARAAALFAWTIGESGDRVGGLCFTDRSHELVKPRGGTVGVLRLLGTLARTARPEEARTDGGLANALQRVQHLARGGSLVALFSDFRGMSEASATLLRRIARHAELVLGFVHDPLEADLPPDGFYPLAGDDGAITLLQTDGRARRAAWREGFEERRAVAQALARASGAHWLDLGTAVPARLSIIRTFGCRRTAA